MEDKAQLEAKQAAGAFAADLIQEGMIVGIGTGTTVLYFIKHLAKRCKQGLNIRTIATSKASEKFGSARRIPMLEDFEITTLDIDVDGADEIDPQKRMIKGGGGALLREKIVAAMSREMIVIVDESKLVPRLGRLSYPSKSHLLPIMQPCST